MNPDIAKLIYSFSFLFALSQQASVVDNPFRNARLESYRSNLLEPLEPDDLEIGDNARKKIDEISKALELLTKKDNQETDENLKIIHPPFSVAKVRRKRFINLFNIFNSMFDETLDQPKIPYVYSPETTSSRYNDWNYFVEEDEDIARADKNSDRENLVSANSDLQNVQRSRRHFDTNFEYDTPNNNFFNDNNFDDRQPYLDGEDSRRLVPNNQALNGPDSFVGEAPLDAARGHFEFPDDPSFATNPQTFHSDNPGGTVNF